MLYHIFDHLSSDQEVPLSHCPLQKSIAQLEEMYFLFSEGERGVGNDHSGMISVHVYACVHVCVCVCVSDSKTRAHI